MSKDYISKFERSAYKFIEELRNISIEANILHKSEVRKANTLIYCVKAVVDSVEKEIEGIEREFKKKRQ